MKTEAQIIDEALNDEIKALILDAAQNYDGMMDDLYRAVGLLVIGRLYGWRVMRLTSVRNDWQIAKRLFGDVKKLMPERGELAHRSLGLLIADQLGQFWEIIRGQVPLPEAKRKALQ